MRATTKDLRPHSKDSLDAVERGEDVTMAYRGKPKARLTEIEDHASSHLLEESGLFGLWRDREDETSDPTVLVRNLRRGRSLADNKK